MLLHKRFLHMISIRVMCYILPW